MRVQLNPIATEGSATPCLTLQEGETTVRFTIQDAGLSDKPVGGLVVFKGAQNEPVGDRLHSCQETDTIPIPDGAENAVVTPAGPLMTIFLPYCGPLGDATPATTGTMHAYIRP